MRIARPEPSDEHPRPRPSGRVFGSRTPELLAALREEMDDRGWLTFATFMDRALFHPRAGYYARLESVGARGDFATSASLTPSFGTLFARQFRQVWQAMGEPARFDVVELGPGAAQFAASALAEISREPRFASAVTYTLVERSLSLRDAQKARLAPWASRVRWVEAVGDVSATGVRGVIFSNEFFDALPCHRLQQTAEGLMEVAVALEGGRLVDMLVPPSDSRLAEEISADGLVLREGQRVEVSLAAVDAMRAIAAALTEGVVITVDYGDVAHRVYHARRPRGTVRGYFRHMAEADPYARPGEQDLTYDVNFSALIRAGEAGGLETLGLRTQGEVLLHLGLEKEIQALRAGKSPLEADLASAPLEKLAEPLGMGESFKVLFQSKRLAADSLVSLGEAPLA